MHSLLIYSRRIKEIFREKTCIFKNKLLMACKSTNDSALTTIQVYEKVEIDKTENDSDLLSKQYSYLLG